VVQNVWTKLLIASDRNPYDRSRARFRTYLYTITVNALRDWFRGERTHAEGRREMPDADGPWTPSESDEDEWNDAYKRAILKSVLDEVRGELLMSNPEKWESFARCALGGESAREVAADLGISVDAVYQHVSRVRKDVTDRVLAQYEEDLAE
jgi:RNA polymerase sigma-70 factor (ECF subfamily)